MDPFLITLAGYWMVLELSTDGGTIVSYIIDEDDDDTDSND